MSDAQRRLAAYLDGLVYEARKPVTASAAHRAGLANMERDGDPTEVALIMAIDLLDRLAQLGGGR